MPPSWTGFLDAVKRHARVGSTGRKLFQILGIVLIFEGLAVIFLSSHFGYALGIASVVLGAFMLILLPPSLAEADKGRAAAAPEFDTVGIKFVAWVMDGLGSDYAIIGIGVLIVALDVVFNTFFSTRPDYGDLDTLSIMLGALLMIYPFAVRRFRVEITFALVFLALVVILLVVPQALIAIGSAEGSTVGNWYVHYMLAAPFAGALNLVGIHASSAEEWVTITFRDGSIQTLGISTACAGLYSFSIFVSAFFAFVLVFERIPNKVLAAVLALGLLAAYVGNLFRMIVIGVVGYYYGMSSLLWAHRNIGWMVFLGWSAVFWYFLMRYADRYARKSLAVERREIIR
jgi:archaeosortase C (PEF-CTERM variant)